MQDGPTQVRPGPEPPPKDATISAQEIEAELKKILDSPPFRRAERSSQFLDYIVRTTLAGSAAKLKEYAIGVEAFRLGSDEYDPLMDNKVRVEAGRLRSRLGGYYEELGQHDPIRIDLPKGSYIPAFSRNGVTAPEEPQLVSAELVPPAKATITEATEFAGHNRRGTWRRWMVVAAVVIMAVLAATFLLARRPARFDEKGSIVLGDFDNTTGDDVFDDTLRRGLAVQIAQSPFLYMVPDRKITATLKLMGRPAVERLMPPVTREVCLRTNSTAMLTGAIARLGSRYVLDLSAVDCNTGDVLADAQEQASSKDAVLDAVDDATISLRSKLGESLSSVQKYSTPLREATTPSLEALKAYSQGLKIQSAQGDTAALPFLKRAVELDPNFAVAYNAMGGVYNNLLEVGLSQENVRKAYALREKLSDHERLTIEAAYYLYVTGELDKAEVAFERWQQIYPRDYLPYTNLSYIYGNLGDWEKVFKQAREAIKMEPNDEINYTNLVNGCQNLNRLDDAEEVYKQAAERRLQGESLLQVRYLLAFVKGDTAQMKQGFSAAMGKPGTEDVLLSVQADTEAWYGRWKAARDLVRRAMDSAQRNDAKETAAAYQAGAALREAEFGYGERAREDAAAALKMAPNRDVRTWAALALARAGNTAEAQRLADELNRAFPLDTLVQKYRLPTIEAAIALQRKDPTQAVQLLKVASPVELGDTGYLLPIYLRGETYLMLHDGSDAAAEFQKFVLHYGLVANSPWGPLARLGLARSYALEAQTDPAARDKARTAYQNFLTLWTDADPDIPIYKEAKAEYAKLQSSSR